MGVVGTRVPPALGQRVQEHCCGLGKTPSQWVRELIERELEGKLSPPALGEAIQGIAGLVSEDTKLARTLLAVSLGIYKALLELEMLSHPERESDLEKIHREFTEKLLDTSAREHLSVEMGLRISDLASEIERIKAKGKFIKGEGDG